MGRIVVGVDGSADSKAALAWAVEEARLRGEDLRVVYVFGISDEHNPYLAAYASFGGGTSAEQAASEAQRWREERAEATRRQAQGIVESLVDEVVDDDAGVRIDPVAVAGGRPGRVLIKESGDCSLLVVGSRGRGGFKGLRLGSIAEKCVRHAPCTVTVVRSGERKRR